MEGMEYLLYSGRDMRNDPGKYILSRGWRSWWVHYRFRINSFLNAICIWISSYGGCLMWRFRKIGRSIVFMVHSMFQDLPTWRISRAWWHYPSDILIIILDNCQEILPYSSILPLVLSSSLQLAVLENEMAPNKAINQLSLTLERNNINSIIGEDR